jgi:hypothetical protein
MSVEDPKVRAGRPVPLSFARRSHYVVDDADSVFVVVSDQSFSGVDSISSYYSAWFEGAAGFV